ncbi:gliding motility-associated C-terminal domain-containing protein [Chryseolinea lacunae]|uniref:Gliding motility-associated C-terminal domain-containing protein n=1 Tax=Chryseolinea lacunae TaxID=2801331 RepID=A0ABS1KST5_9BACT|nr:gliding motility-associated C-terminal domain-containing protein [Chryseolinea lacunae]MBL0742496.1 gliding motility-associated C-terminal domain-containing protein [Chryseolinea lacunae]
MRPLSILFIAWSTGVLGSMTTFGQNVVTWGATANGLNAVPAGTNMTLSVAAGSRHAVALLTNGQLIAWGDNAAQQLTIPTGLSNVRAIAAGDVHNVALMGNGRVVCWGGSDADVITPPSTLRQVFAIAAGARHSVALKANGTVVAWGSAGQTHWQVPAGLHDVIGITAGDHHTVALLANGTVQAWGDNTHHQLDVPAGLTHVIAVAAGSNHTVALLANGTLVVWGDNDPADGDQLSLPAGADHVIAIAAKGGYSLALRSDGTLIGWGDNTHGQLNLPSQGGLIGVAAGTGFGLAITSDRLAVRAWGTNAFNSNSLPSTLRSVKDIRQGLDFTTVLLSNGTVQATGRTPRANVPTNVVDVKQITNGTQHTAALLANGTARAWGENTTGFFQTAVPPGLQNIKALASHNIAPQTMALFADGTVTVWGQGPTGRYHIPVAYNRSIRSIASGANHTLVVYANGTVRGFGLNTNGQLNGIDTLTNVIAVAGGHMFSAALRADGTFLVWGNLGSTVTTPLTGADARSLEGGFDLLVAVLLDGSTVGLGTPMGDELLMLPWAKKIYAVATGTRDLGIITAEMPAAVTPLVADVDVYESLTPQAWPPPPLNPPLTISGNIITSMVLQLSDPLDLTYWPGSLALGAPCRTPPCISLIRNNRTGTLLLSGEASASVYQNILSNLGYQYRGNNWGSVHTISVNVDDGLGLSAAAILRIHLIATNHAPSFVKGSDITLLEDAPLIQQTFAAWATAMSAGPAREKNQTLTFNLSNDNPALFATPPSIDPASGTLSFKLADNANGVAHVTAALSDNGGTAHGGIDRAEHTFTITVLPVNDAPTFTASDVVTTLSQSETFAGWASQISPGPPDEASQTLTFSIAGITNANLFAVGPAVAPDGTLTFTAGQNAGVSQVTLLLRDNGLTANGGLDTSTPFMFTITIQPNQPPSFTKGADVTVPEDGGPQEFNGWATQLSAGPTWEKNQTVAFIVNTDNPALFSAGPALSLQGILSFTTAPDAHGVANVTVILKDNGGTSQGGVDESTAQHFMITVTPVNDAPSMTPPADVSIPDEVSTPIDLDGITAGPNEGDQSVTLTVTVNPSQGLGAVVRYASGTAGEIMFTPAPGFTGTVQVTVHVRDNDASGGTSQRDYTFNVTVFNEEDVYVPTTFSPNNDGVNDVFRLRSARIADVHFAVYTTNGYKIFSTEDVNTATQTGWNGTWKGEEVPTGTYVWVLSGSLADGRPLSFRGAKSGQVLLIR